MMQWKNKDLRRLYETTKANAVVSKPPKISLLETIRRCHALASPPGTPPLADNVVDMLAQGTRLWCEHNFKHENLQKESKDIESMLAVHQQNEELELKVSILEEENAKLRKLVTPKPDKP